MVLSPVLVLVVAICVFAIGYRLYGLFIAKKVLSLNTSRQTPASVLADGRDYHKTNRFILFGQHFAAIAGAGPLMGPVLAAQFGFLPGVIWILIGAVLAGGVHDMVVLFASVRHKGKSIANIAQEEIGKSTGFIASTTFLIILVLLIATASLVMVNAIQNSPWGTIVVVGTIPIAIMMGLVMRGEGNKPIFLATSLGIILLFLTVYFGDTLSNIPTVSRLLNVDKKTMIIFLACYTCLTSMLPVWFLLTPRNYLSTFLKIATVFALAIGIFYMRPTFLMPAFTPFIHGGGPVVPGKVLPFVMVTIACGAVSGFHSYIAAGTTSKMIGSEGDIPFVGYGAFLVEGAVALMALIAACILHPQDYFAINSTVEAYAKTGMIPVDLPNLSVIVKEQLQARPGGAVSLAVGMATIFSNIPSMQKLMPYWYHFAIMFEAVFILTLIDTGTRVGRFILQEMIGRHVPKFNDNAWKPGIIICGVLFTLMWASLLYGGSISTLWPIAGTSNQLLASCSLIIVSAMLMRMGKIKYVWITLMPGAILAGITLWASYINITTSYLPKGLYALSAISAGIILLALSIMILGGKKILSYILN